MPKFRYFKGTLVFHCAVYVFPKILKPLRLANLASKFYIPKSLLQQVAEFCRTAEGRQSQNTILQPIYFHVQMLNLVWMYLWKLWTSPQWGSLKTVWRNFHQHWWMAWCWKPGFILLVCSNYSI